MSMRRPYPVDPSVRGASSAGEFTGSAMNGAQTNEVIESQNDRMVEEMAGKVKQLRALSINIGDEVRGQNNMLGTMNEEFDTTGSLLSGSLKRVKNMASAGHNRWMLYLILFILLVFFICYYLIRWRS